MAWFIILGNLEYPINLTRVCLEREGRARHHRTCKVQPVV